jgi:hypothetical protein
LVFSDEQRDRCVSAGRDFLSCLQELASYDRDANGDLKWKMRPKLHGFDHLLLFIEKTSLNPRYYSCWHDETFMGSVKRIAGKCRGQTTNVLLRLIQRYLLGLAIRFQRRKRTGDLFVAPT